MAETTDASKRDPLDIVEKFGISGLTPYEDLVAVCLELRVRRAFCEVYGKSISNCEVIEAYRQMQAELEGVK